MNTPKWLAYFLTRSIDFIVLVASFLLLAWITDFANPAQILPELSFYVITMFISLQVFKHIINKKLKTYRPVIGIMMGNIIGLFSGTMLVLTLNNFLPVIAESALLVVLSTILAFFVLGTISPMVKNRKQDIIHH